MALHNFLSLLLSVLLLLLEMAARISTRHADLVEAKQKVTFQSLMLLFGDRNDNLPIKHSATSCKSSPGPLVGRPTRHSIVHFEDGGP